MNIFSSKTSSNEDVKMNSKITVEVFQVNNNSEVQFVPYTDFSCFVPLIDSERDYGTFLFFHTSQIRRQGSKHIAEMFILSHDISIHKTVGVLHGEV